MAAIGIDTLRHVHRRSERLLAALPLVLAAHQLVEALVWWGLDGHLARDVWRPAMLVYLVIAFGVVPVLVPLAVGALEPRPNRRRVAVFTAVGVIVAAVLMQALARGPVDATIQGHHISYQVDLWHGGALVVVYVIATCGSLLVSDHRHVRWFGVANLAAVIGLAWLYQDGFVSLWCGWAAVTSVAIAWHLRREGQTPPLARIEAPALT